MMARVSPKDWDPLLLQQLKEMQQWIQSLRERPGRVRDPTNGCAWIFVTELTGGRPPCKLTL